MTVQKNDSEIQALEGKVREAKKQLLEALKQRSGESVEDFKFKRTDGSAVSLSELFGEKSDLIIIHNMGQDCTYCTLWADGFNGHWRHLADRAGFALVSGDDVATLKEFSESRNWGFTCLSGADSNFTKVMGYLDEKGSRLPGVSTFKKEADGGIIRVAHTWFGPGDDFCATWPIFDMLDNGDCGWSPKLHY